MTFLEWRQLVLSQDRLHFNASIINSKEQNKMAGKEAIAVYTSQLTWL